MYLDDEMRKVIEDGMILAVKNVKRVTLGIIVGSHGAGIAITMIILQVGGVNIDEPLQFILRMLMWGLMGIGLYVSLIWSKRKRDQDLENFGEELA